MTTSEDSKKILQKQNKKYIVERWKREFSFKELQKYQEILDLFKIDMYDLLK